jgi:hypothetical protein
LISSVRNLLLLLAIIVYILVADILRGSADGHIVMFSTFNPSSTQIDYSTISWYHDVNNDEVERIKLKFKTATEESWLLFHEKYSLSKLKDDVRKNYRSKDIVNKIAIMLVNSAFLNDPKQSDDPVNGNYVGHYIVIVDYIPQTDQFIYFNPSGSQDVAGAFLTICYWFLELIFVMHCHLDPCTISSAALHKARSHRGTDDEIIIVTQ